MCIRDRCNTCHNLAGHSSITTNVRRWFCQTERAVHDQRVSPWRERKRKGTQFHYIDALHLQTGWFGWPVLKVSAAVIVVNDLLCTSISRFWKISQEPVLHCFSILLFPKTDNLILYHCCYSMDVCRYDWRIYFHTDTVSFADWFCVQLEWVLVSRTYDKVFIIINFSLVFFVIVYIAIGFFLLFFNLHKSFPSIV